MADTRSEKYREKHESSDLRHKLRQSTREPRKRRHSDRNSNSYSRRSYEQPSRRPYNEIDERIEREITKRKILANTYQNNELFDDAACLEVEKKIDAYTNLAMNNMSFFKKHTVDKTPLRVKYFFGEGYTYGSQMERKGPGMERLYAKGDVDEIPDWVTELITKPLVKEGILEEGFVNAAAINVYQPGGCIVSHIDPKHIFDRPIVSVSFFSECALSFGCRFSYKPMHVSEPVVAVPIPRGGIVKIFGFAADEITHCIRPDDVVEKRAVVILRRVKSDAPRVPSAISDDISSDSDNNRRKVVLAKRSNHHDSHRRGSDSVSEDSDEERDRHKRRRKESESSSHHRSYKSRHSL